MTVDGLHDENQTEDLAKSKLKCLTVNLCHILLLIHRFLGNDLSSSAITRRPIKNVCGIECLGKDLGEDGKCTHQGKTTLRTPALTERGKKKNNLSGYLASRQRHKFAT